MPRPIANLILVLAPLLVPGAGCTRPGITRATVAKAAGQPAAARATGRMDPGARLPDPPEPAGGALTWTLPRGWTETHPGGMRYATLTPPAKGKLDVSVVVLPGPAGGELANVNRWRGQIGLSALDDAALGKARELVRSKAGAIAVYDFTTAGEQKSRLVAGLASAGGSTWFLKMVGDERAVGAARPDFIHLLQSLDQAEGNDHAAN